MSAWGVWREQGSGTSTPSPCSTWAAPGCPFRQEQGGCRSPPHPRPRETHPFGGSGDFLSPFQGVPPTSGGPGAAQPPVPSPQGKVRQDSPWSASPPLLVSLAGGVSFQMLSPPSPPVSSCAALSILCLREAEPLNQRKGGKGNPHEQSGEPHRDKGVLRASAWHRNAAVPSLDLQSRPWVNCPLHTEAL